MSLLPRIPCFSGSIPRVSSRLHFFRTGRLQSSRPQSSSSLCSSKLGRFVGGLLGFRGCPFLSFRGPLLLKSSLPRFTRLPPCCHQRLVGRRLRFELIQSLLLGFPGRLRAVLKRGGIEQSQGLFLTKWGVNDFGRERASSEALSAGLRPTCAVGGRAAPDRGRAPAAVAADAPLRRSSPERRGRSMLFSGLLGGNNLRFGLVPDDVRAA